MFITMYWFFRIFIFHMVNVPELLLGQSPSRNDAKIISKYHTKILELLRKTDKNTPSLLLNLQEVLVRINFIQLHVVYIQNILIFIQELIYLPIDVYICKAWWPCYLSPYIVMSSMWQIHFKYCKHRKWRRLNFRT